MMNSLFSSFDPAHSYMTSNYLGMMLIILFPLLEKMQNFHSRGSSFIKMTTQFMTSELQSTLSNTNTKGKMSMMMSLFLTILIFNLMGLMPYVFTITAHMSLALAMALPFWLGFIMFSMLQNTNNFLSHLVPLSTPLALSQFMTIIESVSQIIRPITLSVRLAANMTAGHILMALASGPISILNIFSSVLLVLLILELAVAFIQSYVFTILTTMYLSETY